MSIKGIIFLQKQIGSNTFNPQQTLTVEGSISASGSLMCVNDITAIAKILKEKYKFEIPDEFILKNADRDAIRKAFFKMNNILTEDDYLLIYYSGHGIMELDAIDSMSIVATDGELVDISYVVSKFYK